MPTSRDFSGRPRLPNDYEMALHRLHVLNKMVQVTS